MITLFLSPSCTSCRKARAWLSKHEVAFEEHNIITSPLNKEELLQFYRLQKMVQKTLFPHVQKSFKNLLLM